MTDNDRNPAEPKENPRLNRTDRRTQRSIRFSDPEWEVVEKAAAGRGIAPAEFVRNAAMNAASDKSSTDSAAITPEIVELIKLTHRCAYILSTLKRDEMIKEGRGREMDDMVDIARKAQAELLSSGQDARRS